MSVFLLFALQSSLVAAPAPDVALFEVDRENHGSPAFSPDGTAVYWAAWNGDWGSAAEQRTIFRSHWLDGHWSVPDVVPFSSEFDDDDPYVSPDGEWLYFVSTRPCGGQAETGRDIWRYSLQGPPVLERLPLNSTADEYSPVVSSSGALYFASAREGGAGQGDLYRAAAEGDGFSAPVLLGPAVNHPTGEWNLWVSMDEQELVFEASSRASNVSVPGDLYYSWNTSAGRTPALPIKQLNTDASELMPRLHPDGSTLYYTRARAGGHARVLAAAWPPLREEVRRGFSVPLLLANRSSHEVTVVDPSLGSVTQRIPTGEGPHLLSNVAAGRVMATGYGVFPKPHQNPVNRRPPFVETLNSSITSIDVRRGLVRMTAVLEDCLRPHASWLLEDRAFIVCEDEAQVLQIDLDNAAIVRRFDTRQKGSHVLAFEPSTRVLAVSNTGSGSVTLIEIDSGDTRVLPLGKGSEGALEIDGRIWVANALEGTLSVVDPLRATELHRSAPLCGFPIDFAVGGAQQVWIACFGSSELIAVNRRNFALERRIPLDGAPLNIEVHAEYDFAYLSLPRQNAIDEIDLITGKAVRRIPVGIEPDGLRWARESCNSDP